MTHVDNGVIMLDKNEPLVERLVDLSAALQRLVRTYQPNQAAGGCLYGKERQISLGFGTSTWGRNGEYWFGRCSHKQLQFNAVKSLVTGQGKAGKEQVGHWVCQHLSLPELPFEDAADALAVALCHGIELLSPQSFLQQKKIGPVKAKRNARRSIEALARKQGKL